MALGTRLHTCHHTLITYGDSNQEDSTTTARTDVTGNTVKQDYSTPLLPVYESIFIKTISRSIFLVSKVG